MSSVLFGQFLTTWYNEKLSFGVLAKSKVLFLVLRRLLDVLRNNICKKGGVRVVIDLLE